MTSHESPQTALCMFTINSTRNRHNHTQGTTHAPSSSHQEKTLTYRAAVTLLAAAAGTSEIGGDDGMIVSVGVDAWVHLHCRVPSSVHLVEAPSYRAEGQAVADYAKTRVGTDKNSLTQFCVVMFEHTVWGYFLCQTYTAC